MNELLQDKKFRVIVLLLLLLSVLIYSFLYADYGIKRSETIVNLNSERFAINNYSSNIGSDLYLYVEADKEIKPILESEIKSELEKFTNVKSYANLKEKFGGPVLAIKLIKNKMNYLPFYSNTNMNALVYFSSKGDTTYFEKFKREKLGGENVIVQFKSTEGSQLIKKGDLTLRDESYGVFSLKNYKKYVANKAALRIYNDLENLD
ncbi:MAG: hypothetical protein ABEK36_01590 [Candidatus Aenigmatarchaeota archaeon]